MEFPQKIEVIDQLFQLDQLLIECLEHLTLEEWELATIVPQWSIKDIAAHLLDGNLRALSMLRDGYFNTPNQDTSSYPALVQYLNELNATWVSATQRLSPRVLTDLLQTTGPAYCRFLASLPPDEPATFAVAWAGETYSPNWFHIARDYTEKWHHQQQIRAALNQEQTLLSDHFYFPYLDTSVRALPYHYREVRGTPGDLIQFTFTGEVDRS